MALLYEFDIDGALSRPSYVIASTAIVPLNEDVDIGSLVTFMPILFYLDTIFVDTPVTTRERRSTEDSFSELFGFDGELYNRPFQQSLILSGIEYLLNHFLFGGMVNPTQFYNNDLTDNNFDQINITNRKPDKIKAGDMGGENIRVTKEDVVNEENKNNKNAAHKRNEDVVNKGNKKNKDAENKRNEDVVNKGNKQNKDAENKRKEDVVKKGNTKNENYANKLNENAEKQRQGSLSSGEQSKETGNNSRGGKSFEEAPRTIRSSSGSYSKGTVCVQRFICELQSYNLNQNALLSEAVALLFTIDNADAIENAKLRPYLVAQGTGRRILADSAARPDHCNQHYLCTYSVFSSLQ